MSYPGHSLGGSVFYSPWLDGGVIYSPWLGGGVFYSPRLVWGVFYSPSSRCIQQPYAISVGVIADFLDVTLNLNKGTFKPFSKNNSSLSNVNIDSNHPDRNWTRFLMPRTRGLTEYPSVKEFLGWAKVYMMKPSKAVDSKGDWSVWTLWTPALMVEVIVGGPAHSSR